MITSYAQNFEDVLLWRALKHVDRGFYIDIGAQDPVIDSVSLAFYENGWRGVHVEPTAIYADKLRQARPDERVIQAAIGIAKRITFWELPGTGLSTGSSAIAKMHARNNRQLVRTKVPCLRLSCLLSEYRDREIHWMKIDVEGMEREVIRTWRPAGNRPWIVVVESTKPLSSEPSFIQWEPMLITLGYKFIYFDGLNRFYVHHSKQQLKRYFGPGPNVFDDFALSGQANAPFCTRVIVESARSREQVDILENQIVRLSQRVNQLSGMPARRDKTFSKAITRRQPHDL